MSRIWLRGLPLPVIVLDPASLQAARSIADSVIAATHELRCESRTDSRRDEDFGFPVSPPADTG